jgi:hypothetical protein
MSCPFKKSAFVEAINTYSSARLSNDRKLLELSGDYLLGFLNQLEFEEEDQTEDKKDEENE